MRHLWLLPALMLFAGSALAQNAPPPGGEMVRASEQAVDALSVPPAGTDIALQPAAPAPPTSEAEADALAQAEAEAEARAAAKADAAKAKSQDAGGEITTAKLEKSEPRAASDALARALAEQARRAAEQSAAMDAQREEMKQKSNEESFEEAQRKIFTLKPDQIREVMRKYEEEEYAKVPPSYGQPKPEIAVTTVSLDPGAEPPEIKVHSGFVTTMAILDASGQPWPIQDIGIGGNFDIPNPESGSHIIRISPLSQFGFGNLSIRLKDLSTPVTFRLSAGNDVVHYRYDARIPRMGPNARTSLIQRQKLTAGDDVIMSVLDNAIPAGTKKLKVTGTDKRTAAYRFNERVFVRTPLTLLSPSWNASVSSADGTTVYEVGETPVLLLSDQGQMVRAKISDEAS